jgi:non-specific serine/threonine protein kinase
VAHGQGDYAAATALLEESRTLFEEVGAESGLPYPIACILGDIARDLGDTRRAQDLYERALARAGGRGDKHATSYVLRGLAHMARARNDFEHAEAVFKESLALIWELKDLRCACLSIEGLARVTGARGGVARAARLFSIAEMLRRLVGTRLPPAERAGYERDLAAVRSALSEQAFGATWAAGQVMSPDEAIEFALRGPDILVTRSEQRRAAPRTGLTPREQEVANPIARGLTNRQIAERLVISERTAANHVEHILTKLGFHSRSQVAAWAAEQGLVTTPPE